MRASAFATFARPEWWAIALAGFLVRGGVIVILLPILSLPSVPRLATAVAPTVEAMVLGAPTTTGVLIAVGVCALIAGLLLLAALAGSWLDLALVRAAAADEELELEWSPARGSALGALGIRLAAHVPTLVIFAFAAIRLGNAAYAEVLSPGDPAVPMVLRVAQRAPEALLVLALAWLVGEAVGGLAARRRAAGESTVRALPRAIGQVLRPRGLATLALTSAVVLVIAVPSLIVIGDAWERVRADLIDGAGLAQVGSGLVVLAAGWALGLTLLGASLAWRATAWTAEARGPRRVVAVETVTPAPAEGTAG